MLSYNGQMKLTARETSDTTAVYIAISISYFRCKSTPNKSILDGIRLHAPTVCMCTIRGMLNDSFNCLCDTSSAENLSNSTTHCKGKGKGQRSFFYIAQYPVRWAAQSALHFFAFPDRPVHSDTVLGFSGKHSSHAAITRND